MDRETFISEVSGCSVPDLELIRADQKELYTDEEMLLIEEILERKKQEIKKSVSEVVFGEGLFCLVGILSPIIGLIVGIIMLAAGSPRWKQAGRRTFRAVFTSLLMRTVMLAMPVINYSVPEPEIIRANKKKLYTDEELLPAGETSVSEAAFGEGLFCLVGILSPIIGLIVGIIMLAAGSPRWKQAGRRTFWAVFISVLVRTVLVIGFT